MKSNGSTSSYNGNETDQTIEVFNLTSEFISKIRKYSNPDRHAAAMLVFDVLMRQTHDEWAASGHKSDFALKYFQWTSILLESIITGQSYEEITLKSQSENS